MPLAPLSFQGFSYIRTASPLATSHTVSFDIPMSDRQTISFGAGYDRFSSFLEDATLKVFGRPTWKMRAIPISVSYKFNLLDPKRRLIPVAEFGMSFYFSGMRIYENENTSDVDVSVEARPFTEIQRALPPRESRLGMGYGVHAGLGLRYDLNRDVFVIAQSRLRYINGLGLSYDNRAEFSQVDFVVGFGFKF